MLSHIINSIVCLAVGFAIRPYVVKKLQQWAGKTP